MNKYNWATVPPEVNWIATDEDGWAYGFIGQPKLRESNGFWSPVDFAVSIPKEKNSFKGDWRESLEKRPEAGDQ
ncbi:hypothetical protein A0141_RS15600 [Acinetobacter baumannii]|nr:hypothetical protein [Acinetobacter baumannii]